MGRRRCAMMANLAMVGALAPAACKVGRTEGAIIFERTTRAAEAFVADATAGRYDEAYARLCPEVAARQARDVVAGALAANPFLREAKLDAHTSRTIHGATELEGAIAASAGTVRVWFYFSARGDEVCLTGALIGGTPLLPAYAPVPAERAP